MIEYHKIQTVYLRNPDTKFKTLLAGQYAEPEFAYLAANQWVFTEKVDGTNIRIMVTMAGGPITFGGRTDNASIPAFLVQRLQERFLPQADLLHRTFPDGACLYGEGYGARIQKGGGNYRPDVDFVLFDVLVRSKCALHSATQTVPTTQPTCANLATTRNESPPLQARPNSITRDGERPIPAPEGQYTSEAGSASGQTDTPTDWRRREECAPSASNQKGDKDEGASPSRSPLITTMSQAESEAFSAQTATPLYTRPNASRDGSTLPSCTCRDWWLQRAAVEDVSAKLTLDIVPIIGRGSLPAMVELARVGMQSRWGDFASEGIVARPATELKTRNGKRVITKIKTKDFATPEQPPLGMVMPENE